MRALPREMSPSFWTADFSRKLKGNTRDILRSGCTDRQVVINEPYQSGFPVTPAASEFSRSSVPSEPLPAASSLGRLQKPAASLSGMPASPGPPVRDLQAGRGRWKWSGSGGNTCPAADSHTSECGKLKKKEEKVSLKEPTDPGSISQTCLLESNTTV